MLCFSFSKVKACEVWVVIFCVHDGGIRESVLWSTRRALPSNHVPCCFYGVDETSKDDICWWPRGSTSAKIISICRHQWCLKVMITCILVLRSVWQRDTGETFFICFVHHHARGAASNTVMWVIGSGLNPFSSINKHYWDYLSSKISMVIRGVELRRQAYEKEMCCRIAEV